MKCFVIRPKIWKKIFEHENMTFENYWIVFFTDSRGGYLIFLSGSIRMSSDELNMNFAFKMNKRTTE